MASGLLPIVSDIPANRKWVIPENNGILINALDSKDLASAIIQAYKNVDMCKKYSTNSIKKITTSGSQDHLYTILEKEYMRLSKVS